MIQFTTSKGEYVVVEVPKGSFNCWVKCGLQIRNLLCSVPTNEPNRITTNVELLLSGINYTFICTTDDISEEVAASIVGNYAMPLVEFANIIDNNNLSPLKNYAICKMN